MIKVKDTTIYATDIHGDLEFYKKLLDFSLEKKAKYLIIGGDITPLEFLFVQRGIQGQRDFLELKLIPTMKEFQDKGGGEIFIMPGNDDHSFNLNVLQKAEIEGFLKLTHNRIHKIGNMFIAGYSFINSTPFMFKDWEKAEEDINTDLLTLCTEKPEKMIFSLHAPPFNTKLDVLYDGNHVGSVAVREFIEKKQPYLGLHGHIHESPEMSGDFKDNIGKTLILNPGSKRPALFDLNKLENVKVFKI